MATDECATELQLLKHRANDIGIPEAYSRTEIYTNNKAAVQWAASVNLVVKLKTALLSNCLNSALSQVFSYAALVALLNENKYLKTKPP